MKDQKNVVLCPCCMEEHEQQTRSVQESNIINGIKVHYNALYEYCSNADEYYATEQQIRLNDINAKDAYRKEVGLLTSSEISDILSQYQITQADFSEVLGWGQKTVTRYMSFQVQTSAHDKMLRKIKDDPKWFLDLLRKAKNNLKGESFKKYERVASDLFAAKRQEYTEAAIESAQAIAWTSGLDHGKVALSFSKLVDMINCFASDVKVTALYTVKLMKLLWYADFLCYKRNGQSISGLAYQCRRMGALPFGYKYFNELDGVNCEEIEFDQGTGYLFKCATGYIPRSLSTEELNAIDTIINLFGNKSKDEIVEIMHSEDAYKQTDLYDIISYSYAKTLSVK